MIKGGTGGALTNVTGLKFEKNTDIGQALTAAGLQVEENKVFDDAQLVCISMPKRALYRYLKSRNVKWEDYLSNTMEPDECLYFPDSNHFLVIEKKWQETSGSVDEKLAACDFKLERYTRLFSALEASCSMIYLLNSWFTHPRYKDVIEYMESRNCAVYFEEIPPVVLRQAAGLVQP
jgi:hypothetical protein